MKSRSQKNKRPKTQIQGFTATAQMKLQANALGICTALGVLLVIALSYGVYYRFQTIAITNSTDDYYAFQKWQPFDIVESRDIAFSFVGAKSNTTSIPSFWELEPGKKYVIVDVSFKNKMQADYQLSPIMSMTLTDESGELHRVTSSPVITKGLGGAVRSGLTAYGEVGFTVPDSVTKFSFKFEPYVASSAPITVDFELKAGELYVK